jgi:biopolymer transport protein ExbD
VKFFIRKRRQPPAIIIISLIDILIVVLIFLMVTTTFKQAPALKLALPESKQSKTGASENSVLVTIAKTQPFLYLGPTAITAERLEIELQARLLKNPQLSLVIRADTEAPWGQVVKVMDVAKNANIKFVNAFTKNAKP